MKSMFKKKKIFTLLEVMTVTIIILVITGLGILSYRQIVENARQRVCALNLKALEKAIKFYSLEEDVLPASLGELKLKHLEKAYAEVMREGDFLLNKLAFFIVKINTPSLAYGKSGGFLTPDNLKKYGVTEEIFHCPSDPSGEISYAINEELAGKKWEDIAFGVPLVACTSCPIKGKNGGNLFNSSGRGICGRHFKKLGLVKDVSQAVFKGGMVAKEKTSDLVNTFTDINNNCIIKHWQNCAVICLEESDLGMCVSDCRRQNRRNYSNLISCIKGELD